MKRSLLFLLLCPVCACSVIKYTQVVTINSDELNIDSSSAFFYEDNDIRITYNFSGNAFSFLVQNLGAEDIEVDLSRSFLGVNGLAFDYYMDKTISYSSSTALSHKSVTVNAGKTSQTKARLNNYGTDWLSYNMNYNALSIVKASESSIDVANGYSVSYKTKPISIIPYGQGKVFCEFPVLSSRYTSDNLEEYPQEPVSVYFSGSGNSPIRFVNRIMILRNGVECPIRNTFYVSGITNIKTDQMRETSMIQIETGDGMYYEENRSYGSNRYNSPNNAFVEYEQKTY